MKVIIEAINSPSVYRYSQTTGVTLRIYANTTFTTYDGQVVLAGSPNNLNSHYLEVECEIQGGNILYIPSFEIDSTEDSPTDRTATYTAWLFASGERLGTNPFLAGFGVPTSIDPATGTAETQTWTRLVLHRDSRNPPPRQGVYDIGQVEYLITQALALLRMASETQVGNVALDEDPTDPNFPVAISATSPRVALAQGRATLVGGFATVGTAQVTALSNIQLTGQDQDCTGNPSIGTRVPFVSFEIISDNGADSGVVGWVIYP